MNQKDKAGKSDIANIALIANMLRIHVCNVDNYGPMYLAAFDHVITKLVSCTALGYLSYVK